MINKLKKRINDIFKITRWSLIFNINKKWHSLEQPKNISRADPFIIKYQKKNFILFEECDVYERKGCIKIGELDIKKRKLNNITIILKKNYHLSFPFIFTYKKNIYLIPESHEIKKIDLYKFVNFPTKIKKIKTLVKNINAADSVLFRKNKLWWLLTNIGVDSNDLHSKNLSIFYSKNLLKKTFVPHNKNPVITDIKYARNAGNLRVKNKKIFRVSQNCEKYYGHNINILEINKISINNYKETLKKEIFLRKKNKGFHTYNNVNKLIVADMKTEIRKNFLNILRGLLYVFVRIVNFLINKII